MIYSSIAQYESTIRLSAFIGSFSLLLLWQWFRPWRITHHQDLKRVFTNIGLMLINTFSMRLLFPVLSISASLWAAQHGIGLANYFEGPTIFSIVYCFIALDLIIYCQHRLLHKIPLLWRFHRIHHLDGHLDVSSGVRFHPLEAIASLLLKVLAIIMLGAPVVCVIAFEVALNSLSLFNHANIKLSARLDRGLRILLVTPNMHRIHHSTTTSEYSSNFGFNLSLWDKLFNTYLDRASLGEAKFCFGQNNQTDTAQHNSLLSMLYLPFKTRK